MTKSVKLFLITMAATVSVCATIWFVRTDIQQFINRYALENKLLPIPIIGYGAKIISGETKAVVIGPYPYPCRTGICSGVRLVPDLPTTNAVLSSPKGSRHWVEEWKVTWKDTDGIREFVLERKSDGAPVRLLLNEN